MLLIVLGYKHSAERYKMHMACPVHKYKIKKKTVLFSARRFLVNMQKWNENMLKIY
jgi:hypothetical protein